MPEPIEPIEDPADRRVGEQLEDGRPVPAAGFRGALARHLEAIDPGYGPRPVRLWLMVAATLAVAAILLLAGAAVALGAS